ncbi:MAG: copper resistance protein B [Desulfuromonadales bacterium]|nr:copper resistance protein B [Desulfuromonadales bacterium]NIS42441.1 copper resistance protein B [Desulfuromonadales bacterium]
MTSAIITVLLLLLFAPDWAAAADEEIYPADYREAPAGPPPGQAIRKYAEDAEEGAPRNFGVQAVHDNRLFATFKADRFEHQWRERGVELFLWDVAGWIGNDYDKLYLESEGEVLLEENEEVEEAMIELLYSRNIARFWDLQAGLRHDVEPNPERTFLALGVQGLAPQWFEIDATAYLSEDGDLSALIEAEYELMLTQRWVVIPRLEAGLSAQDVPEYGQWQGITDVTLGARLMYHVRRELAPYLGATWSRKIGETAHMVDKAGGDVDSGAVVAGLRFWF